MGAVVIDTTFWVKLAFMVFVFFEAFLTGLIPTWSRKCRESPKILGIANSFAAGVFLAIAFVHILPEEVENWAEINDDAEGVFPLPYLLVFLGYTLILIIDKVMFDTHALFDNDHDEMDPAEEKLATNVRASMIALTNAQGMNDPAALRKSTAMARQDLKQSVKEYLSKEERLAVRMKASMKKSRGPSMSDEQVAQNELFVDGTRMSLLDRNSVKLGKYYKISF